MAGISMAAYRRFKTTDLCLDGSTKMAALEVFRQLNRYDGNDTNHGGTINGCLQESFFSDKIFKDPNLYNYYQKFTTNYETKLLDLPEDNDNERVVVDEAFGEAHSAEDLCLDASTKMARLKVVRQRNWHNGDDIKQGDNINSCLQESVLVIKSSKYLKLAHYVTTKESTANYEIIILELPEDSEGAREVDDGMKHVSSDAHQIEIYHLI